MTRTEQAKTARIAATTASTVWVGAMFALGGQWPSLIDKAVSLVPALIGYGVVAFDLYVWKWPGINRLTNRPRIGGTWNGNLQPTKTSHIPAGGNRGPIPATVVVEQTYWSLHVRLYTSESSSYSTVANLSPQGDSRDSQILTLVYENSPDLNHRTVSHPHAGAAKIILNGRRPKTAAGAYWTDRLTIGTMALNWAKGSTDVDRVDVMPPGNQDPSTPGAARSDDS